LAKTPGEHEPLKPLSKAEREARKQFGQAKAGMAMSDQETERKAFSDNHERLKAERLAREAAERLPKEQR
jgi:hypothetical protein